MTSLLPPPAPVIPAVSVVVVGSTTSPLPPPAPAIPAVPVVLLGSLTAVRSRSPPPVATSVIAPSPEPRP